MQIHPFYIRKEELLKSMNKTVKDFILKYNFKSSTRVYLDLRPKKEPPKHTDILFKFAEYTGCSLDYLIYGTGHKPIEPGILKIVKTLEEISKEDPDSLKLAQKLINTLKKTDTLHIVPPSLKDTRLSPGIEEILELLSDQKAIVIDSALEGVRASIDFYGDVNKKENSGTA